LTFNEGGEFELPDGSIEYSNPWNEIIIPEDVLHLTKDKINSTFVSKIKV
jgi:hypothetical protein